MPSQPPPPKARSNPPPSNRQALKRADQELTDLLDEIAGKPTPESGREREPETGEPGPS